MHDQARSTPPPSSIKHEFIQLQLKQEHHQQANKPSSQLGYAVANTQRGASLLPQVFEKTIMSTKIFTAERVRREQTKDAPAGLRLHLKLQLISTEEKKGGIKQQQGGGTWTIKGTGKRPTDTKNTCNKTIFVGVQESTPTLSVDCWNPRINSSGTNYIILDTERACYSCSIALPEGWCNEGSSVSRAGRTMSVALTL
jgi:hypothetical protein